MRAYRLRAEFEGWIPQTANQGVKDIPGKFVIEIRLTEQGRRSIYRAFVMPTLQPLEKTFGLSALPECKSYVESQFKRKLSDWQEV